MGSSAQGTPNGTPTPSMYGASVGGQQAGYGTGQDLFGQSASFATPGAYGAFAPQQAGYGGSQVQSTEFTPTKSTKKRQCCEAILYREAWGVFKLQGSGLSRVFFMQHVSLMLCTAQHTFCAALGSSLQYTAFCFVLSFNILEDCDVKIAMTMMIVMAVLLEPCLVLSVGCIWKCSARFWSNAWQ